MKRNYKVGEIIGIRRKMNEKYEKGYKNVNKQYKKYKKGTMNRKKTYTKSKRNYELKKII